MEYKQFIFKLEWEPSIEKLTTLQKGILLQVFYDYHNGRDLDYNDDVMVEMLWLNLLPNIERMNQKYRTSVENGRKGGVPKGTVPWNKGKQKTDSEPNTNPTQSETNQPRTLKVKVKEKVKDNVVSNNNTNIGPITGLLEIDYTFTYQYLKRKKEEGYNFTMGGVVLSDLELEEYMDTLIVDVFSFNSLD